jgi:hypothetical protein
MLQSDGWKPDRKYMDVKSEDQQAFLGTEAQRLNTGNHSIVYRVLKTGRSEHRARHPLWRGLLAFIWTGLLVWGLARLLYRKLKSMPPSILTIDIIVTYRTTA